MKKIALSIELTYDADLHYGNDDEAKLWFFEEILGHCPGDLYLHSNIIGDAIGEVQIIKIEDVS